MESVPSNLRQISKQTYVTHRNDYNENRNEYAWCRLKLSFCTLEYIFRGNELIGDPLEGWQPGTVGVV
jgi:hypothetical protein